MSPIILVLLILLILGAFGGGYGGYWPAHVAYGGGGVFLLVLIPLIVFSRRGDL